VPAPKSASLLLLTASLPAFYITIPAGATGLTSRSLQLRNDTPGTTTDYTVTFTLANTSTVGSLHILLCSNSPLPEETCDLPNGGDVTNAQLTAQSGITDFNLFVAASNDLVLSRIPSVITAPLTVSLTFHNIINPTTAGPYYVRLATYSSTNVTGSPLTTGGLAFAINSNLQISSVVPPYLTFCSALVINGFDCASGTGDYVNFGTLSPTHSSQADSQLVVATNASNGYVIQVYGSTMTSGNNVISALTSAVGSQPGTSQFGINLRANTNPAVGADPNGPGSGTPVGGYNLPNRYQFVSNDVVASSPLADNFRKYTASYVVNTGAAQAPGVYVSTITYVGAGSF
jgi:hypothetical protein